MCPEFDYKPKCEQEKKQRSKIKNRTCKQSINLQSEKTEAIDFSGYMLGSAKKKQWQHEDKRWMRSLFTFEHPPATIHLLRVHVSHFIESCAKTDNRWFIIIKNILWHDTTATIEWKLSVLYTQVCWRTPHPHIQFLSSLCFLSLLSVSRGVNKVTVFIAFCCCC